MGVGSTGDELVLPTELQLRRELPAQLKLNPIHQGDAQQPKHESQPAQPGWKVEVEGLHPRVLDGVKHQYGNQGEEQDNPGDKQAHTLMPDGLLVGHEAFSCPFQTQVEVYAGDEHGTQQEKKAIRKVELVSMVGLPYACHRE